jgi:hypothetical protein
MEAKNVYKYFADDAKVQDNMNTVKAGQKFLSRFLKVETIRSRKN